MSGDIPPQCYVEIEEGKGPEYVGLAGSGVNIIMIIISIVGIIINSIFSISYYMKKFKSKNQNQGVSIVQRTLTLVASVETVISICWLFNNSLIQNTDKLKSRCTQCKIIAHFEVFLYVFDWMILSTSLYQIKKIIISPTEILVAQKTFKNCLLYSLGISLFSFVFTAIGNIVGVSPMITCFINITNLDKPIQKICFWLFFLLPLIAFSFAFYQVYLIMKSPQYKNDKELFKEYSYFIITYIFTSIILILCYIVNFIRSKYMGGTGYKIYISIITLISCMTPLIVGCIRIYRTDFIKRLLGKPKVGIKNEEKLLDGEEPEEDKMFAIEKKLFEKLILKYFIAISYSLGKSKYENEEGEEENKENKNILNNNEFNPDENVTYKIDKNNILKDLDLAINEDIKVLEEPNINIKVTEYNNSIFKKLRSLEGFNEDKIIEMFQPKKGTFNLIRKVKDKIFNINSTNKLLLLKQIKKDELLFYQRNILSNLYEYLSNHPNSLICRVFGLYKIIIDDEEEVYFALMYNVNESLDIVENINILNQGNEVRHMKISEADLKKNIVIDSKTINEDQRKRTIDIQGTHFDGTFVVGGNLNTSNNKIFKISLTDYENDKLMNIIEQDSQFLRGKNILGFKFLVFEKNIENKDRISIFKDDDKRESEGKSKTIKLSSYIKKYVFNSNLSNIIYSISIMDFFNKKT